MVDIAREEVTLDILSLKNEESESLEETRSEETEGERWGMTMRGGGVFPE